MPAPDQRFLATIDGALGAADDARAGALEHEIAHRKEVEAALRAALAREKAAREEAERALHFNELFAGVLGHDLRNPLGLIGMSASHLARTGGSDRVERTAARIVASAERMGRMVDQLLDLTRSRSGALATQRTHFDLADVWRGVAAELAPSDGATAARVAIDTIGDTTGDWDRDRLAKVATNLVDNALVHGTTGAPVAVAIDGSAADTVTVRIHNDGAVAGDVLPVMFEPFRGIGRRGPNSRGLGLGLYIARQIVDAHAGTIGVSSSASDGTTLTICLPRHQDGPSAP